MRIRTAQREPRRPLPTPLTELVGRERELAAIAALLRDTRLVTLTGAGGIGKTRLAQRVAGEVAPRLGDGTCWVDLAALTEPRLVPSAVARSLGVRQGQVRPLRDALSDFLRRRHLLLVMDNCEHLLDDCAVLIEALLQSAPDLRVLATSREVLGLPGETTWVVPPLSLPDVGSGTSGRDGHSRVGAVESVFQSEAGQLFLQRARAVRSSFELTDQNAGAIAAICHRLDGIPLALELAAARLNVLSAEQILARLGDRLGLLTSGARSSLPRHRTLAALLDWSHDLLSQDEQVLFRRLAVFVGGWTCEAAGAVCGESTPDEGHGPSAALNDPARMPPLSLLDVLAGLVDKSLILVEEQGPPMDRAVRYRMLETIREYASERLAASGETDAVEARHAAYFIDLAERAEPKLRRPERETWLSRLDHDRENLRVAERRAAARGDSESVLRLGAFLWRFWEQADAAEAREHVEAILALAASAPPSQARVKALLGAGVLARRLGDYPAARALAEEGLAAARLLDYEWRVGIALYDLGRLAYFEGRYAEARRLLDDSLAIYQEHGYKPRIAATLNRLGYLAFSEGDLARARALLDRSLAVARLTPDAILVGATLFNLGLTAHFGGDLDAAQRRYQESRAIFMEIEDRPELAMVLNLLGHAATMQGRFDAARSLYCESLLIAREIGNRRRQALVVWAVATLAAAQREPERAVRLESVARTTLEAMGAVVPRPMQVLWDEQLAPARRALGARGLAAADAAGRATTLESVVEGLLPRLSARTDEPRIDETSRIIMDHVPDQRRCQASGRAWSANGSVLTVREREVTGLIARGLSNQQIARHLVISERTVANHIHSILGKLGFRGRAQVVAWAVEGGFSPLT